MATGLGTKTITVHRGGRDFQTTVLVEDRLPTDARCGPAAYS